MPVVLPDDPRVRDLRVPSRPLAAYDALIEAHGDRIIDLKIPGCRPTISPDGKHIAWGSGDHELDTAPLDTNTPMKFHAPDHTTAT